MSRFVDTTPQQDVITAMMKSLEKTLNEEADKEIEKRVEEFRTHLSSKKTPLIVDLLNSVEIMVENNPMSRNTNFSIYIRPTMEVHRNEL